jgi:hypothetical protein
LCDFGLDSIAFAHGWSNNTANKVPTSIFSVFRGESFQTCCFSWYLVVEGGYGDVGGREVLVDVADIGWDCRFAFA